MTTFMDKDFLLNTETACKLYHDYAASCPIIDYHCHISPAEIAQDKRYADVAEPFLGLAGDAVGLVPVMLVLAAVPLASAVLGVVLKRLHRARFPM